MNSINTVARSEKSNTTPFFLDIFPREIKKEILNYLDPNSEIFADLNDTKSEIESTSTDKTEKEQLARRESLGYHLIRDMDMNLIDDIELEESKLNKTIKLIDKKLVILSPQIGSYNNLIELYLGGNYLQHLPDSFEELKNLKELVLSCNEFSIFPNVLFSLKNLKLLNFYNNKLKEIPRQFNKETFPKMRFGGFNFCMNRLKTIPLEITIPFKPKLISKKTSKNIGYYQNYRNPFSQNPLKYLPLDEKGNLPEYFKAHFDDLKIDTKNGVAWFPDCEPVEIPGYFEGIPKTLKNWIFEIFRK